MPIEPVLQLPADDGRDCGGNRKDHRHRGHQALRLRAVVKITNQCAADHESDAPHHALHGAAQP